MADNKTVIILSIGKQSGVLGRATASLTGFGLQYHSHHIDHNEATGARLLILEANGELSMLEGLVAKLTTIPGVEDLIDIRGGEQVRRSMERMAAASPPAATSENLAGRMVAAYPDIAEMARRHELTLHAEDRRAKMIELGEAVGQRIAENFSDVKKIESLKALVAAILVPVLDGLASAEADSTSVKVSQSEFSKHYDKPLGADDGVTPGHCSFITGFIQGFVNESTLPLLRVSEPRCIGNNGPFCHFRIASAAHIEQMMEDPFFYG